MGYITYNEGESHILSSYFQNIPISFGPFYVGLGNGAAPVNEYLTLREIAGREISETGYSRHPILRNSSSAGWELRGDTVWSPELVFTNTGLTCWEPVNFAFLTLSPQGNEVPTTLISASDFKNSIVLKPGQSLRMYFTFKQMTQYSSGAGEGTYDEQLTAFITEDYIASIMDTTMLIDSTTGPITLRLPFSHFSGKTYYIKDWKGTSETNPITVVSWDGDTIDDSPSFELNVNYQSITLLSNGTDWSII